MSYTEIRELKEYIGEKYIFDMANPDKEMLRINSIRSSVNCLINRGSKDERLWKLLDKR